MERAKYIVKFLIMLAARPQELWEYLCSDGVEESDPDYVQRNYYFPLLGFMALEVLVCEGLYSAEADSIFNLQQGMLLMVPRLVAFLVGPYLAMMVLKMLLTKFFDMPNPSQRRLHLFAFYCNSFLMALEMLLAFIPSIRFFWFIVFYLLYITWTASTSIIRVDVKHRWVFGFLSSVIIYFSSHLVMSLIERMQG